VYLCRVCVIWGLAGCVFRLLFLGADAYKYMMITHSHGVY
jgi:hypothetical protein